MTTLSPAAAVIELTEADITARVDALDAQHDDFDSVWCAPSCCTGCRIPYTEWSAVKVDDFEEYSGLRWLRGDTREAAS
ncbi:MAG: hypothetical protein J0J04_08155 [Microbacterium sp.]|uniref:hypothetical protein n=1 Tax=Microbacterium sp. TaxID=51671 RepID=UPI001AD02699|nr:hypothetical protein [Microbacterium sp.]MBN9214773.1 hypothetical protein [Microbacterium sp.]